MRKILITGSGSYIGESMEKWLTRKEGFQVDTLDMQRSDWQKTDFSEYDTIFHVAGIAHFSKDEKKKNLYYQVNTELTATVAAKAKAEGVAQFIFMSSIIVYGDSSSAERVIRIETKPSPTDFYGDSKWQAEQKLGVLDSDGFRVVIVRPPMIYGKGSKGNYPRLAKLARTLPIFPKFSNKRSMLHIDNLCAFIEGVIITGERGVFFPQNKEYVCTSDLVRKIAASQGKKIYLVSIFNPFIKLLFHFDTVKKVFGNLVYDQEMSQYAFDYQINDFEESIKHTEL